MSYTYEYPRPMVTVDIVLLSGLGNDSFIMLVERRNEPFKGMWALPGGFMDIGETTAEAAKRELKEETNLDCEDMLAHSVQDAIDRDPRGRTLSVVYVGILDDSAPMPAPIPGDDAVEARWFSIHDLPELAFDHSGIVKDVLSDYGFEEHMLPPSGQFLMN